MKKWTDEELRELEDPDTWDWDTAEVHPANPHTEARVVVRVSSADFQRIARCAERTGERLTAFFLAAALERVERLEREAAGAS